MNYIYYYIPLLMIITFNKMVIIIIPKTKLKYRGKMNIFIILLL